MNSTTSCSLISRSMRCCTGFSIVRSPFTRVSRIGDCCGLARSQSVGAESGLLGVENSTEPYPFDVDRNQHRLRYLLTLCIVGVDSAGCRHLDALELPVVRRVIGSSGATKNVDCV